MFTHAFNFGLQSYIISFFPSAILVKSNISFSFLPLNPFFVLLHLQIHISFLYLYVNTGNLFLVLKSAHIFISSKIFLVFKLGTINFFGYDSHIVKEVLSIKINLGLLD